MLVQFTLLSFATLGFGNPDKISFDIARQAPTEAAKLQKAPVAFSFEFSSFPQYFVNTSQTWACLSTLKNAIDVWPSIRLGGTSQDQSLFDSNLDGFIVEVAESRWHYSKGFIELAAKYRGPVVLGLNRGADKLANTIDAAQFAQQSMSRLYAIELGNEPVLFAYLGFPIAPNSSEWNYTTEAASESHWQAAVGQAVGEGSIIRAGNFVLPYFNSSLLFANEDASSLQFVRDYAHHHYPQTVANTTIVPPPDLRSLMSHVNVSAYVDSFQGDITAAREWGSILCLERQIQVRSHNCKILALLSILTDQFDAVSGGGSPVIFPTFGDALGSSINPFAPPLTTSLDFISIKAPKASLSTSGGLQTVFAPPFYGGYLAAQAMAGGSYIAALDAGTDNFAGYVVYSASCEPIKVVLINSNFFDGTGERSSQMFQLRELVGKRVEATRLTAANAWSRQDKGDAPTLGGRSFSDETCELNGDTMAESVEVVDGIAILTVSASEALLVEL